MGTLRPTRLFFPDVLRSFRKILDVSKRLGGGENCQRSLGWTTRLVPHSRLGAHWRLSLTVRVAGATKAYVQGLLLTTEVIFTLGQAVLMNHNI